MAEESEQETLTGRLEDLASDPKYLKEYLGIRVDIREDQETGTVIAHGNDIAEVQKLLKKDRTSENPGDEYHIFHPPKEGKTSREVQSFFLGRKLFGKQQ